MRKLFNIALTAVVLAALSSCTFVRINNKAFNKAVSGRVYPSQTVTTSTYSVPQFTGIDASIAVDVEYIMTESDPMVEIEAPENYIDHLYFPVEDGILKVRFDDDRRYAYHKIRVKVSSATLESLTIRGAGDFKTSSGIDCSKMDVQIFGAGDVTMDQLNCEGEFNVQLAGAGDIYARGLSCQAVKAAVLGAGDVLLTGNAGSADLKIAGAGDIDISGLDCENVSTSISGAGKVKRK